MLEEIEASRAEAELRSAKNSSAGVEDASEKPKRKPTADVSPPKNWSHEAPCNCRPVVVRHSSRHPTGWSRCSSTCRRQSRLSACRKAHDLQGVRYDGGWRDADLADRARQTRAGIARPYHDSKFDDHIPLYRLSRCTTGWGIDISRSVMADWVGRVSALLTPLVLLIRPILQHSTDTYGRYPVDVLDPDGARQKPAGSWVYVFDGSGYQSATPAAIAYYYSPDRKGAHPADHLASFSGVMHADGYGGYKKLYGNQIVEAACIAHVRRKFHDVIKLKPSRSRRKRCRTLERSTISRTVSVACRLLSGVPAPTPCPARSGRTQGWIETTLSTLRRREAGRGNAICAVAMGRLERLQR